MGWELYEPTEKCTLYTIVFQMFVFCQLFNQINARKLGEREFNVFSNFFNNWMFLCVYALMWVIQIGSIEYGGRPLRTVPLSTEQNLICAGIGAFSLIWGVIIKFIPGAWFNWVKMPEHEMDDKEEEQTLTANLRKSFR